MLASSVVSGKLPSTTEAQDAFHIGVEDVIKVVNQCGSLIANGKQFAVLVPVSIAGEIARLENSGGDRHYDFSRRSKDCQRSYWRKMLRCGFLISPITGLTSLFLFTSKGQAKLKLFESQERQPREPLPPLKDVKEWVGKQLDHDNLPKKYQSVPPEGELIPFNEDHPEGLFAIPNKEGQQRIIVPPSHGKTSHFANSRGHSPPASHQGSARVTSGLLLAKHGQRYT